MKFKRVDDVTVRCIITEEDMHEYNVNVSDFLNSKEKTYEFLHEIVERAVQEVGFRPQKGMLSMQVMALPKNGLAITFSENGKEDLDDIIEHLSDLAGDGVPEGFFENLDEMTNKKKMETLDKFMKELIQEASGEYEEEKKAPVEKKEQPVKAPSTLRIYRFDSLKYIERFCNMISKEQNVVSGLYKNKENREYYLVIEKASLSDSEFHYICNIAVEYGKLESDDGGRLAHLKEHCECMIEKNAIHVMTQFA